MEHVHIGYLLIGFLVVLSALTMAMFVPGILAGRQEKTDRLAKERDQAQVAEDRETSFRDKYGQ